MKVKNRILSIALMLTLMLTLYVPTSIYNVQAAKKPSKVTIKSTKLKSNGDVSLTWNDVKCTGYQVYRAINDNTFSKLESTTKTTYIDDSLSGKELKVKYKVRAYKKGTVKQYYNSKTKKWVTKKPIKKNWKGKKTRKVKKTVYGNFSDVKGFVFSERKPSEDEKKEDESKQPSEEQKDSGGGSDSGSSSGGTTNTPADGKWIKEDTSVSLPYGNTTIHLGQEWTNSIKSALAVNSSATYEYNRCDIAIGTVSTTYHSVKAYAFDAADYSDYLLVEVCEGQILDWYTNSSVQAVTNSTTVKRGENKSFANQYNLVRYTSIVAPLLVPFNSSNYESNGVVISGAYAKDFNGQSIYADNRGYEPASIDRWDEKQVGLHIINAYRVLSNRRGHKLNPLQYNKYLDGTNSDGTYIKYTGDVEAWYADGTSFGYTGTYHLTNQAFGAQGFVDTLTWGGPADLSKSMHSMNWRTAGPCAGGNIDLSAMYEGQQAWEDLLYRALYEASGRTVEMTNGNAASGGNGESTLLAYKESSGHLTWYTADNNDLKYIGIGIKNGYNQVFGGTTP